MDLYLNLEARQLKPEDDVGHPILLKEASLNHCIFLNQKPGQLLKFIKEINSLLNSGKTRDEGLHYLLTLLPQCSHDVIAEHGECWIKLCSQVLSSSKNYETKAKACTSIGLILDEMKHLSAVQRTIPHTLASTLVPCLIAPHMPWSEAAFICLHKYLLMFPGHCHNFKGKIEEAMLSWLDAPVLGDQHFTTNSIVWTGKVFAALAQSGRGSGETGKANLRGQQLEQLLTLTHTLSDQLFKGVLEKQSYEVGECSKSMDKVVGRCKNSGGTDVGSQILSLITTLINIFVFIEQQLVSTLKNQPIIIKPQAILEPILRILQVEVRSLSKQRKQEYSILALFLPSLQQRVLMLLLIILKRPSIAFSIDMYWGILMDQLVTTLATSSQTLGGQNTRNKTNDTSTKSKMPGESIRILTYDALIALVKVSNGRVPPPLKLASIIMKDITPLYNSINLQKTHGQNLTNMNVYKKRKRKGYTAEDTSSSTKVITCHYQSTDVVRAALNTTTTIFNYSHHSLSPKFTQVMECGLMDLIEIVEVSVTMSDESMVYCTAGPRAAFYNALSSLCLHPHPQHPPHYLKIYNALHIASSDPCLPVVIVCQEAMGMLSFILANPEMVRVAEEDRQQSDLKGPETDLQEIDASQESSDEDNSDDNDQEENKMEDLPKEKDQMADLPEKEDQMADLPEEVVQMADVPEEVVTKQFNEETAAVDSKCSEESQDDLSASTNNIEEQTDNNITEEELNCTSSDKRPAEETVSKSYIKKQKIKLNKDNASGPSVEEMLATFVDIDPET